MKKAFVIITIAMCTLFVTQAKANLIVHNYTGLQMNIKMNSTTTYGVSSTSGTTTFLTPTGISDYFETWPGLGAGGTGSGITEWLLVGHPTYGFSTSATSAYTWGGTFGVVGYTVTYIFTGGTDIVLVLS